MAWGPIATSYEEQREERINSGEKVSDRERAAKRRTKGAVMAGGGFVLSGGNTAVAKACYVAGEWIADMEANGINDEIDKRKGR